MPLTLLDIIMGERHYARQVRVLIGMSYCRRRWGGALIHIAAGLQFFGFRSVIDTLGGQCADAKHTIEAFYEKIFYLEVVTRYRMNVAPPILTMAIILSSAVEDLFRNTLSQAESYLSFTLFVMMVSRILAWRSTAGERWPLHGPRSHPALGR